MKEVLETVIKSLVDKKEEVSINEKNDARAILFEVKVATGDMGKVIGKNGKMAGCIRTLMKSIASKEHKKIEIKFLDK